MALLAQVDALFAAHQDLIYTVCLRWLGDPQLAAEVAQESMLKAYEKLHTFRGEAQFRTWLVRIARYECLNARRKRRDHLTEDGVLEGSEAESHVLQSLHRAEQESVLRAAIDAVLDGTEAEVLHLRYIEQMSVADIDALMQLDLASGARAVLQRSRRKLQAELRRRLRVLGHASSFLRSSKP